MKDDARLHVAALTFEDVANERIFAMADKFTWKYEKFCFDPYH